MIYFLSGGGRVRIGFAKSPGFVRRRHEACELGSPIDLELLGVTDGTLEDERVWHQRFGHLRVRHEWFEGTAELLEAISEVAVPLPDGRLPGAGTSILLDLNDDLFRQIERARGDVPRVRWIRRAIRDGLALRCPHEEGCDFRSPDPAAICPRHGRRVRAAP